MKLYISILKEQVAVLQYRMSTLILLPQYFELRRFYGDQFMGLGFLKAIYLKIKQDVKVLQNSIEKLKTPEARAFVKRVLKK